MAVAEPRSAGYMLHDGSAYWMYLFRGSTADTLYQFAWDGSSYAFGHKSIPVLTLTGAPTDVDASSLSMLHSGGACHAYLRRLGTGPSPKDPASGVRRHAA